MPPPQTAPMALLLPHSCSLGARWHHFGSHLTLEMGGRAQQVGQTQQSRLNQQGWGGGGTRGGCHKAGKSCFALLCSQPACTQPLRHLESTRHNATKGGHALKQQNNNKNPKQKKIHLSASPNPWGETGVGRNRPKEPQLEPCRAGRLPVLLAFPGELLAAVSVSHRWPHQCGAVGFWDASGCTRSTRTAVLWRSALGEGNKTEGSCQNEWV